MISGYASYADVLRRLDSSRDTDSVQIVDALRAVEGRVNQHMIPDSDRPWFAPSAGEIDHYPDEIDWNDRNGNLWLLHPASTVSSVTLDGVDKTSSVSLRDSFRLKLAYSNRNSWSYEFARATWDKPLKITATWGWLTGGAWTAVTTLASGIVAGDVSIDVADASAISLNHLLQIGSEWLHVTEVSDTTLTVTRGVNGSDAANHDSGVSVSVWYPPQQITYVVSRQAAMLYKRRADFETSTLDGIGVVNTYPADLLPELRNTLQEFPNAHRLSGLS